MNHLECEYLCVVPGTAHFSGEKEYDETGEYQAGADDEE